jgi:hypothetical protein
LDISVRTLRNKLTEYGTPGAEGNGTGPEDDQHSRVGKAA